MGRMRAFGLRILSAFGNRRKTVNQSTDSSSSTAPKMASSASARAEGPTAREHSPHVVSSNGTLYVLAPLPPSVKAEIGAALCRAAK
jgi:hypothetical protein